MSIVHVLNKGFDYEGERTMGVFSTREKAYAAMLKEARSLGYDEVDYPMSIDDEFWPCGSTTFYIYEMQVDA